MSDGEKTYPQEETLMVYDKAKEKLRLKVGEPKGDRNLIKIEGDMETLHKIFPAILDDLDSRKHTQLETDDGWKYVCEGEQLRPGGTYAITVDNRREKPEMLIMNVNARNYEPINKPMHEAVQKSIIEASKNL